MIGPIKQELLSGIRDNKVYNKLKDKITAFAKRRHLSVFTTDNDFKNFSKIIDYKLHLIRENIKQN
jgi:predicted nuclease of predicted toxin-antitoxin system